MVIKKETIDLLRPEDDPQEATAAARAALREPLRDLAAYHMDACVKCGLCGETCHVYLTDPVPENLPAAKAAKVVRHFRRYHSAVGRLAPWLVGAKELTQSAFDEIVEAVYGRCTGCGRCGLNCSVGADVGAIIRTGRNVVAAAAEVPPNLQAVVDNQINTGNQMAITVEELKATAAWLSEDLQLETGDEDVRIHVDEPGKRVFYLVNPREVKFFPLSLSAAAGVFRAAGENWTMSSKFYDVTNYGLYSGDDPAAARITKQVMDEAARLEAEEVVLSECGHGFRSFRWEGPNWLGEEYPIRVRSILEVMLEYIEEGRIEIDPGKNVERVTLHDPCNLVRWGGVSEPQRKILAAVASDFVEMTPNREQNFCCGGGGGMLSMSEYGDRRVQSGAVKADQIRATGAKIIATPCHNCADQLLELNKKYSLGVEIQAVCELVFNALVIR
ncbi:MAG: (Fe-S)-binding protein [Candidatus Coatesbacteria bacterium]|nr:MAG: (Fe-S)-binding protein [Candidatus Coatesbacteria bacterium]